MADIWYYTRNGQQQGPVVTEDLQRLAASGELGPDDLVWEDDTPTWVRAKTVKRLFPNGPPKKQKSEPPRERASKGREDRGKRNPARSRRGKRNAPPQLRRPTSNGALVGFTILGVLVASVVLGIIFFGATNTLAGTSGTQRWRLGPGKQKNYQLHCGIGREVTITVKSNRQSDMDLLVYNGGRMIKWDTSPSSDCAVTFIAPSTGTYRVQLINQRRFGPGGRSGPNHGTISYSVRWRTKVPAPIPKNRNTLTLGQTIQGRLKQGESRTYSVRLQQQTAYVFDFTSSDFDPKMEIFDKATNIQLKHDDNGGHGNNSRIVFVPNRTGEYLVKIRDRNFFGGAFTLSAHQGTTLNVGNSLNDWLSHSDQMRIFRVHLSRNKTYRIDAKANWDTHLSLYTESGDLLLKNDDFGFGTNSRIAFRPLHSGYYLVGVTHDFRLNPFRLNAGFQLSVNVQNARNIPPRDGEVILDPPVSRLTRKDQVFQNGVDSFIVKLDSRATYQIDAEHQDALMDTYLEVYDSRGTKVAFDNDTGWGQNARIRNFRPARTEEYRIQVRDARRAGGRYRLKITNLSAKKK